MSFQIIVKLINNKIQKPGEVMADTNILKTANCPIRKIGVSAAGVIIGVMLGQKQSKNTTELKAEKTTAQAQAQAATNPLRL